MLESGAVAHLTKTDLYRQFAVCMKTVHRRKMPLTHFDGLIWNIGEPQAWGDPPTHLPIIIENDFLSGENPVRFPQNQEVSSEGYFIEPAAAWKLRDKVMIGVEEGGLEFWLSAADVGVVAAIAAEVDRYYVNVLHDWALLDGVALRRPGWEVTLRTELGKERRDGLAGEIARNWQKIDGAGGELGGVVELTVEERAHVTVAVRG